MVTVLVTVDGNTRAGAWFRGGIVGGWSSGSGSGRVFSGRNGARWSVMFWLFAWRLRSF